MSRHRFFFRRRILNGRLRRNIWSYKRLTRNITAEGLSHKRWDFNFEFTGLFLKTFTIIRHRFESVFTRSNQVDEGENNSSKGGDFSFLRLGL